METIAGKYGAEFNAHGDVLLMLCVDGAGRIAKVIPYNGRDDSQSLADAASRILTEVDAARVAFVPARFVFMGAATAWENSLLDIPLDEFNPGE